MRAWGAIDHCINSRNVLVAAAPPGAREACGSMKESPVNRNAVSVAGSAERGEAASSRLGVTEPRGFQPRAETAGRHLRYACKFQ